MLTKRRDSTKASERLGQNGNIEIHQIQSGRSG